MCGIGEPVVRTALRPYRRAAAPMHTFTRTRTRTRLLSWLASVAAIAALFGGYHARNARIDREVRELPAHEQRALFARTLDAIHRTCHHRSGPRVERYCRDQSEFVEHFPQCDQACRESAERLLPHATR
jgi:hypothetical protein